MGSVLDKAVGTPNPPPKVYEIHFCTVWKGGGDFKSVPKCSICMREGYKIGHGLLNSRREGYKAGLV